MRRRVTIPLLVLAVGVAACGGEDEPAVIGSMTVETFDDFGAEHFSEADVQAIVAGASAFAYETFPATSGPHAGNWAPCGIYAEEVPEIFSVHSMEHGAVVIHHQPGLAEIAEIHALARDLGSHVVVTPRSGLAEPVVLTAWTVMGRMAEVDLDSIRTFWDDHSQRGPERLPCPFEVDQAG